MEIREIRLDQIHAPEDWNCRGSVAPIDVVDLARDIDQYGLQNALSVRTYPEAQARETGFPYHLVSGYRRYMALRILQKETAPCSMLGFVSDTDARIMNLGENLNRKDLNMWQEAQSIHKLKLAGLTQDDVSRKLHQSRGWVQVRFMLLDLPKEIQEEVAAGIINQTQVRDLYTLGVREKQLRAAKVIKERKEKGERTPILLKAQPITSKRARKRPEVFDMMSHIQDHIGNNFGTRTLAWAAGEISTKDLYDDIAKIAEEKGIAYAVPQEEVLSAVP